MHRLEGFCDFGGHVVFVMLGQDFVRDEYPVGTKPAPGYYTLSLTKQVWQDSRVFDGDELIVVVTSNCTVSPSLWRLTLPSVTSPPILKG
jgi:hypothetical protein